VCVVERVHATKNVRKPSKGCRGSPSHTKKYTNSSSSKGRILDRCRAFDLYASVDAHFCQQDQLARWSFPFHYRNFRLLRAKWRHASLVYVCMSMVVTTLASFLFISPWLLRIMAHCHWSSSHRAMSDGALFPAGWCEHFVPAFQNHPKLCQQRKNR
jgi:hypothetical protein